MSVSLSDGRILRGALPLPLPAGASCFADGTPSVALAVPGLTLADSLLVPVNQRVDVLRQHDVRRVPNPTGEGGWSLQVRTNGVVTDAIPGPYQGVVFTLLDSLNRVTLDPLQAASVQVTASAWLLRDGVRVGLPAATRTYRTSRVPAGWNVLPGWATSRVFAAVCMDPAATNYTAVGDCEYGTTATGSIALGTWSWMAPMPATLTLSAGTRPGEGAIQPGTGTWTIAGKGDITRVDDVSARWSPHADADSGDVLTFTWTGTLASGRTMTVTHIHRIVDWRTPAGPRCYLVPVRLLGYANGVDLACDATVRGVGIASLAARFRTPPMVSGSPTVASPASSHPEAVAFIGAPDQCGAEPPGTPDPWDFEVVVTLNDGRVVTVPVAFSVCTPHR